MSLNLMTVSSSDWLRVPCSRVGVVPRAFAHGYEEAQMIRALLWQLLLVTSLALLAAPVAYEYGEAFRKTVEMIP